MSWLRRIGTELWRDAQIVFWAVVLVPYICGVIAVEWCYERVGKEPWWWTPPTH